MTNYKPPTDAQLTAFLRVCAGYDTVAKAAEEFGIAETSARRWLRLAKDRNLTGKELTAEAKLRIQLAAANRDLKAAQREADSAERIRTEIFNLAARTPEPPAWLTPAKTTRAVNRDVPMTIWSDWHYGEVVRAEEVGGVNEFNAVIATERIARLVNATVDLCFNHMGRAEKQYPGIVVMLGGDMLTGDIHEELTITNDRTTQQCINDLTDLLIAALEHMADKFGRVFIPCVVGNHGRSTHKPRMKGRIYTSHEWNIYCNLERHFRRDKRLQFMIPDGTDARFKVYNHRFLLTHGDSLGVKGGDGIIGSLGPIRRGTLKVARAEAQVGRDVDTIVIGHWHTYLPLRDVIVNGSLKGYDEYARLAMRAPYEPPIQALWWVHPDHGMTAQWPVYVDESQQGLREPDPKWLSVLED